METPPPVPVATLDYYEGAGGAAGATFLVRRLAIVCIVLGAAWALANLFATVIGYGFTTVSRGGGFPPFTLILSVILTLGGLFSLRENPRTLGRRLIEIYAIGTLANVLLARLFDFVISGFGFPFAIFPFLSMAAYSVAFPVTLLIVLRTPAVRAVYH